jgi:hypothetical protein
MRVEGYVFAGVGVFLLATDVVYWMLSEDATGTTALFVSVLLSGLIAFYLLYTSRRIDPRPEDESDADVAEGAGEVGFFSPYSWWPLPLAATLALAAVGMAIGWWLVIIASVFAAVSVFGFVFEYYLGRGSRMARRR